MSWSEFQFLNHLSAFWRYYKFANVFRQSEAISESNLNHITAITDKFQGQHLITELQSQTVHMDCTNMLLAITACTQCKQPCQQRLVSAT